MKKFSLIVISFLIYTSCKNPSNQPITVKPKPSPAEIVKVTSHTSNNFDFLKKIKTKNFPLIESTNFNNFLKINKLSVVQIKLLNLYKVTNIEQTEPDREHTKRPYYINYQLNFSDKFKAFVVSYENSEHEISTYIVTYSNNYILKDSKKIAYDEIAESMFQIESEITKTILVIIEKNYFEEESIVTKTNFTISDEGIIKKLNT